MSDREDVLREKTHKGAGLDSGRRVFYTLGDYKGAEPFRTLGEPQWVGTHRTMKLVALLVAKLQAQGVLTEDDVDEMLLELLG